MVIVTLKEVAKRAGVSTATASQVLNKVESRVLISEPTKKRIFGAAKELNYQPNIFARSLRSKKSHMLGVTISYLVDPYCATIVHGINEVARARGYRLVLFAIQDIPEPLNACREIFGYKSVDGVVVVGSSLKLDDRSVRQLSKEGMKIALVGREIEGFPLPSVLVDNVKGGFLATEHLIKLGHKRVGFIESLGVFSQQRLEGAMAALRTYGLDFNEGWSVSVGTIIPFAGSQAGYEGMREILKREKRPSAIFAFGDVLAFGAIVAIRERGLRVPEDIAIVGFDDMVNVAAYYNPPLTTVRQPMVEMGKRGADLLIDLLQAKGESNPSERIVLEPELVVRKSSGRYKRRENLTPGEANEKEEQ